MPKRERSSDDERLHSTAKQSRHGDTHEDQRSLTEDTTFSSSSGTPANSSLTSVSPTSPTFPLTVPGTLQKPAEDSSDSDCHPQGGAGSPDHELPSSDIIDSQLHVAIVVKLENEQHEVSMSITLSEEGSYHRIEKKADNLAMKKAHHRIQFYQGNCTISTAGTEHIDSFALQSYRDWPLVLGRILAQRIGEATNNLRLTVTRTYAPSKQPAVSIPANQKRSSLLRNELKERMIKPESEEGGNRVYISRADLDKLMSREAVQSIVQEDQEVKAEDKLDLTDSIYHKARTLLALFVYARHRLSSLKLLLDDCYNDESLPLQECPEFLDDSHENLLSLQWIFLAPVFTGKYMELGADAVIPIISWKWYANGSHSNVYRIRIEPSHLEINGLKKDPNPELALKVLKNHRDPSFSNEQSVLQTLQGLQHNHIVRLLCTYKHNNTYNMLFPLAKCNLRVYMEGHPPEPSKETSVWFLSQLMGLAEALSKIHNYKSSSEGSENYNGSGRHSENQTIYHHDLKPENILYFPPTGDGFGSFQIADFGLAKINPTYPSSSSAGTSTSGTATYAPPEADPNSIKLGRPYDIWSMGCIFLELLVWFCYGPGGCKEFHKSREPLDNAPYRDDAFFIIRDGNASLRSGVKEWIEKLREHPSCKNIGSLGTTVTLVEEEMLEVDHKMRKKSNRCVRRLREYLEVMEKEYKDPPRSGNLAGFSSSQGSHNADGNASTTEPSLTTGGAPILVLPTNDFQATRNIAAAAKSPPSPVEQRGPDRDLLSAPLSRHSNRLRSRVRDDHS
ncbi:hypothetical protein GP486_002350 [Trichoglossum hirsutum]|uniref:Protein kinase domain-containing protein n=1 Tax=Trichoglossum hirsutum TaxID=265104 RepID=A0A9P8LEY7_9PEZI|nr:hypothetical protein GP486_002350 [Trichoglossum hirsutum]